MTITSFFLLTIAPVCVFIYKYTYVCMNLVPVLFNMYILFLILAELLLIKLKAGKNCSVIIPTLASPCYWAHNLPPAPACCLPRGYLAHISNFQCLHFFAPRGRHAQRQPPSSYVEHFQLRSQSHRLLLCPRCHTRTMTKHCTLY